MDAEFWLERWRDGRTHFHQDRVLPLLQKYWPTLGLPPASRVLVPLCGKSLDMLWLAAQGHRVLGVELSEIAAQQFFDENGLQPAVRHSGHGVHYVAGDIEIICGDIFALDAAAFAECIGVYDRAALIALPSEMRSRYVEHVYARHLAPWHYKGLLITLDYAQDKMNGPPFSVGDAEVQSLFESHASAAVIDRRDILAHEPKFAERGLTTLDSIVYRLEARP
jgi:thiopurine S-methyltransferase